MFTLPICLFKVGSDVFSAIFSQLLPVSQPFEPVTSNFEPVPSSDQRCKLGNSKRKRVTDFRNQFPAAHLSWGYVTARPVVRHDFFSLPMFVRSEPSFMRVPFKKSFQKHMNAWFCVQVLCFGSALPSVRFSAVF